MKLAAAGPGSLGPGNPVGGRPLWPGLNTQPATYPPLSAPTSCDVAVIGGGVSGALVAFMLVEAGFDVVVLEQHEVAGASTAANTALLLYETDVPLHRLAERMGEATAVQVYRLCRDAVKRFDQVVGRLDLPCGFAPRPSLYLASREADVPGLRREHEMRARHGFAVEILEHAHLESRYGLSNPAALLSHDGGEIDPVCFTRGLVAHAARGGARVHERTAVAELVSADGGIELTTAAGHVVRARHAILATGYRSELYLDRRLVKDNSTYALATEPLGDLPRWPDRALIWETARPYLYLRTTPDNRIVIGGLDERDLTPGERDSLLESKCLQLVARLKEMFPSLEPRVSCAWCGTFLNSPDSLPYIGEHPEVPNLHLALCYGGNGTTFGLVAAELLRDAVLGREPAEAGLFALGRPVG